MILPPTRLTENFSNRKTDRKIIDKPSLKRIAGVEITILPSQQQYVLQGKNLSISLLSSGMTQSSISR